MIEIHLPIRFAVPAVLEAVVDGDTLAIVIRQRWLLRLEGIDTPEHAVPEEHEAACVVDRAVAWWLRQQTQITAYAVDHDKYGGRLDGDVTGQAGGLVTWLLARRLGRPYDGGRKPPWTAAELAAITAQQGDFPGNG